MSYKIYWEDLTDEAKERLKELKITDKTLVAAVEKKEYSIPIRWESYERFNVEAYTLEEAIQKALKLFLSIPDDKYLEESFGVDDIIFDEYKDEAEGIDLNEIYSKL